jgi:nucleolar GTP-binding protein
MAKEPPIILLSEKLLDNAFRKAVKKFKYDRRDINQVKKTIISRTNSFTHQIITTLEKYVKTFPSIEHLPLFYQELLDIKIGVDKLKKSLGAVDWARKTCRKIYSQHAKVLKKNKTLDFLRREQREIYGRISSVVKQIDKELHVLVEAQTLLRRTPEISDIPTIVIAGYPNVGKSSLLRCLSSARPKIARYPFTTKEIHIGHMEKKECTITRRYQIIDTPGLLDRPLSQRNTIERQAIAALTHLADVIIFILDTSETCGYTLKDQHNLLCQIKKMFLSVPIIIVENKVDLKHVDSPYLKISCKNNEGIEVLMEEILRIIKENRCAVNKS